MMKVKTLQRITSAAILTVAALMLARNPVQAILAQMVVPNSNSVSIVACGITHNTDDTYDVTYAMSATVTDSFTTIAWKAQISTNADYQDVTQADWIDEGQTNFWNIWITPAGAGRVSIVATQQITHNPACGPAEFFRAVLVKMP